MKLAELLLRVADVIARWIDRTSTRDRDKLTALATYLEGISTAIARAADMLAKGELPHADCEELRVHLANIRPVIAGLTEDIDHVKDTTLLALEPELYAVVAAPISMINILQRSRWAILGNYRDAGAPIVIGKQVVNNTELPMRLSATSDFPDRVRAYSGRPGYSISIDVANALEQELEKLRVAAGRFSGSAKALKALAAF